MRGKNRNQGTHTSLDGSIRTSLGLSSTGKKGKKMKTRKEMRKEARSEKRKKNAPKKRLEPRELQRDRVNVESATTPSTNSILPKKKKQKIIHKTISTPIISNDPEDEEIERLERLLGVTGKVSKRKIAEKLNKEYEMYEGITGNFGDFLMQLDDLTDSIQKGNYHGVFKDEGGSDDEDEPEKSINPPRLLDDSEQESSDIEPVEEEEEEDDDDDDEESEEEEDEEAVEEEGNDSGDDEVNEKGDESDGESHSRSNSEEDDELDSESEIAKKEERLPSYIYRPTQGEDIYGRTISSTGTEANTGKYIPPARRGQVAPTRKPSSVIDESSESFKLLKRQLNGQLNRLSEQTRDSVLKAIGDIFKCNSMTILCHILRHYILSVCGNPSQLMESLVPLYASLVAALHVSVHHDIGSYLLESITLKLVESLATTAANQKNKLDPGLISDKTSTNMMLFLVYLYNLRVVHHRLIMDLLESFITPVGSQSPLSVLLPERIELILCVIEHCGPTLRSDDPQGLKNFVMKLNTLSSSYAADTSPKDPNFDGRLHFMIACISDLKNNKSRRSQSVHSEAVVVMRKWIGRVKSSKSEKGGGDGCLTVSLQDLLQADTVGRWWRAGASWGGRDQQQQLNNQVENKKLSNQVTESISNEEQVLLKLANKFHMNTSVKRDIFVVVMSSRDAADAFERLLRLDLKGKQDREVIRVIATICGLEKNYNEFYSELLTLFCGQNRQNRTTLQYVFWDFFKLLMNENNSSSSSPDMKHLDRKAINMARLLANMVTQFFLSLSILKVIDMSSLTSSMMLFLATFFLALFSTKISDETFAGVLDRIATTSDCLLIRENIMIFLQKHLESFPSGLPANELKLMKKRRKLTLHTLDSMSVLDIAQGLKEKEDQQKGKRRREDAGDEDEELDYE